MTKFRDSCFAVCFGFRTSSFGFVRALPLRFPLLAIACLAVSTFAAETPAQPWPLWDGHESIEQYAKRTNLPPTKTLDLGNGVKLELVLIPAGKFIMGTPEPAPVDEDAFRKKIIVGEAVFAVGISVLWVLILTVIIRAIRQRHRPQYSLKRFIFMMLAASVAVLGGMHWSYSTRTSAQAQAEYSAAMARHTAADIWEKHGHEVTLTRPYYIGRYEVTQEQYEAVTGKNPSEFKGASLPVDLHWNDAQKFCGKVSEKTGQTVQLPTEAQWEFACRAGTMTEYYNGDTEADLARAAWYRKNSGREPHSVGQKEPNAWGVYDMLGNAWELCRGEWKAHYKPEPVVDPQDPPTGQFPMLLRGGSWDDGFIYCRSTYRDGPHYGLRTELPGFRVVVEVPKTR